MHVRIKITLLFTFILCVLLGLFCGSIYYFFYDIRLENMKAHLTNQAITTANMLNDTAAFNPALMKKIDSLTVIPMRDKTIQVYNSFNEKIYTDSDMPQDSLRVTAAILDKARIDKAYFFTDGNVKSLPGTIPGLIIILLL